MATLTVHGDTQPITTHRRKLTRLRCWAVRKTRRETDSKKLASQCKIVTRGKGPGYGAVVCGTDGCSWTLGYESRQIAVDKAYERCVKQYQQCQSEGITSWEDFRGFKVKNSAQTNTKDCRPKTQTLRCTSNCVNGNCVLTYDNGCKINVQVPSRFDSFSKQWTYPAPSC